MSNGIGLGLVLFSTAIALSGADYNPPRLQPDIQLLERQVAKLTSILGDNGNAVPRIAGSLDLEDDPTPLYASEDGRYPDRALDAIRQAVQEAVQRSGRYREAPTGVTPTVGFMLDGRIVYISLVYPGVAISQSEEREKLMISIWICRDRLTALSLFWLRRGGKVLDGSELIAPTANPDFHLHSGGAAAGEQLYQFGPNWQYNAPLLREDPRAGGDRMGFLRGQVVVEAATWTYVRALPQTEWRTMGMLADGAKEVGLALQRLDEFIRASSDRP